MKFRLVAVLAPLALAACQSAPLPDIRAAQSPDSPDAGIRSVRPAPVMSGYVHRIPVEPASWRELNERQSPANGARP